MDTKELESGKIKVLKEIADINLLISEGKATLRSIEERQKKLIEDGEVEIQDKISKILVESSNILEKAKGNYAEVHEFYEIIKGFSDYIKKSYQDVNSLIVDFKEKTVLWKDEIKKQESQISSIKTELEMDRLSVDRDKKYIKVVKEGMDKERKHIESQQATLETSYEELKKLWDKIQQKKS